MSSFITANLYFSTLNRLWNLGEKQVFKQIYEIVYTKCTDLTEVNRHFDVYFCEDTSGLNRWNNCRFLSFLKIFSLKLFEKVTNKIKYYTGKTPGKIEKTLDFKPKIADFLQKIQKQTHNIWYSKILPYTTLQIENW